ncbi:MAG: 50S ribosomal protein L9 [Candidatus Eisenbacteria bacterium]|nr:50S ribosomal protein L9 [Candidatus Eisenbacteria bacterium]
MEIILLEDVEGLGNRGERVSVAKGYARNYLLPRTLALPATSAGARMFAERERIRQSRADKERNAAEELAHKLSKVSVTLTAQVGEDEKLFGSVTAQDIADALGEQGFDIDRRRIQLEEPIKVLGVYRVDVKLYQEIGATIKVWVAKQ